MFIAPLFINAKTWKQPRCLREMDKQTGKSTHGILFSHEKEQTVESCNYMGEF